jgi:hypothetical protein
VKLPRHVAVRLDEETIARIDALVPGLSSAWHTAKRSDALRAVILAGLDTIEAQRSRAARKPRK